MLQYVSMSACSGQEGSNSLAGRLVKYEHVAYPKKGSSKTEQLPLAVRQRRLLQRSIETAQRGDLVPQVDLTQGVQHLRVRDGVLPGVHVVAHRSLEQEGLLRDHVEPRAQGLGVQRRDVDAVDGDAALVAW